MTDQRKSKSPAIVQQPVAQLSSRFVAGMKARIRTAQVKAALAANAELVLSYWVIGRDILASQKHQGWCAQVIDRFATDLQREFPKLTGYRLLHVALKAQLPKARQIKQLVAQMGVPHEK